MAKFVFRLDPLLEARRRAERNAQVAMAGLQRRHLDLLRQLRRHQDCIAQGKQDLRGTLIGRLDVRALRLEAGEALHAVRRAHQVVLELAGLTRRLEAARQTLIEATKRRRALELLRDRRFEQWKAALDKAETAALDELAARGAWGNRA